MYEYLYVINQTHLYLNYFTISILQITRGYCTKIVNMNKSITVWIQTHIDTILWKNTQYLQDNSEIAQQSEDYKFR